MSGRLPSEVRFPGRILFLTEDIELLKKQLAGTDLPVAEGAALKLIDNISTDEITPGWVCFYYDETLGQYALVGLRGNAIEKDSLKNGGFSVIVSGISKGCGSSRETAPFAEMTAGIRLVVAKSIEKIYGQNSQNIGLLTTTNMDVLPRIARGEAIPLAEFTRGLDPISKDVVEHGGLFNYNKARLAGEVAPPALETTPRPMTLVEKIIARSAVADAKTGRLGVPAVKPGDALFARTSVRFSHEYVTPMAEALFVKSFGPEANVRNAKDIYAFRDHLTFIKLVMPVKHKQMGLLERAEHLAVQQRSFTERQGIRLYDERPEGGSEAICHNAVVEDIARPGDLIAGTDSHTCTAGALGCFAFGVGATDMANAWFTEDVRVTVPRTVLFRLHGQPPKGVVAKDIMLAIMAQPYIKTGKAIGQVLEFEGDGLTHLSMDERVTMTNLAVEAGAFTGIIAADEACIRWIQELRGLTDAQANDLRERCLCSDPDAEYVERFDIDLTTLTPFVATPGDPRNGVPLGTLPEVKIDIAYGGSCTGGKMADMDQYAEVLAPAVKLGKRVAPGVQFYIQFGSQRIKEYANSRGYVEIFKAAGAEILDPSCGACIRAGPGVSTTEKQVSVSAINRNFPGRSGPGQVYLASPRVVAASALAGKIVAPDEDRKHPKPAKPKALPQSWIWVGSDAPETRIYPHDVTLGVEIDPAAGATIDLFVERGGKTFTGLTVQAIRVPGLKSLERLAGAEIIDPPPPVVGIGRIGAALPTCGGTGGAPPVALLKKLAPEDPTAAREEPAPEPETDDEPEGDDDEVLGDIESYRRRRAEEGKLDVADDPELDADAIEEAEAAAAAERVLIAPGRAYEVERIRLTILGMRGAGEVEIVVDGLGRQVEDDGELAAEPVRFGGRLVARLEVG